jgi:nitronate monooxygenase
MAGGPTTPALVSAACGAGAFGVLAGAYTSPDALRDDIRSVRAATSTEFGVNLLLPQPYVVAGDQVEAALRLLRPYARELGVELVMPENVEEDVDVLLDVVLEERVGFFSFTFGVPPPERMAAFRDVGCVTCGTATTVAEARALVAADSDMVCVQAGEAGGHRGGWLDDPAREAVALVSLVPLIRDAVDVPVIAAGGIMDGRGIAAALSLGADAAQLGTAFLLTPEAGTSEPYRAAVRGAVETDTTLTRAFSGRAARGIRNRMADELAEAELPPYPVMNALTRPLRRAAAEAGRAEFLSLWAGHGVPAARTLAAADLVGCLERETDAAIARMTGQPVDSPSR